MPYVADPESRPVSSRRLWNNTGLLLKAGVSYSFTASGTWKDFTIDCGPDGYVSPSGLLRAGEGMRRMPKEDWFTLIGALDSDPATMFRIGSRACKTFKRDGVLTCFANDIWWMYWNNRGSIDLTVAATETCPDES